MLYIVATPIGNLKDISHRAVEVLQRCDYILCEDTRTSLTFLNAYNIDKKLVSYHKFNEASKCKSIADDIRQGRDVALISDAGMPGISDPGAVIIRYLKAEGLPYTVIPGPSALINAFVLSGYDAPFTFVGFLPDKKKERNELLTTLAQSLWPSIYYVSPHSIHEFFGNMYEVFGDREVCVVRELTKKFEEVSFTTLAEGYHGIVKGEFVCVVKGGDITNQVVDDQMIVDEFKQLVDNGLTNKDAIKEICDKHRLKKNYVYNLSLKVK